MNNEHEISYFWWNQTNQVSRRLKVHILHFWSCNLSCCKILQCSTFHLWNLYSIPIILSHFLGCHHLFLRPKGPVLSAKKSLPDLDGFVGSFGKRLVSKWVITPIYWLFIGEIIHWSCQHTPFICRLYYNPLIRSPLVQTSWEIWARNNFLELNISKVSSLIFQLLIDPKFQQGSIQLLPPT